MDIRLLEKFVQIQKNYDQQAYTFLLLFQHFFFVLDDFFFNVIIPLVSFMWDQILINMHPFKKIYNLDQNLLKCFLKAYLPCYLQFFISYSSKYHVFSHQSRINQILIAENIIDSNQMRAQEPKRKFEKQIEEQLIKNGEAELFSRAFLKPIEIVLKTWENQTNRAQKARKRGKLPYGIKQVLKSSISDNKYVLADFDPVPGGTDPIDFKILRYNNWDNIISAIKSVNDSHIKLAICVCMYSEDKEMLKRTISGIKKSIVELTKQGIFSHDIVVCVVMDGIEHVHPSIVEFIEEIEKYNGIFLDEHVQITQPKELARQNSQLTQDQFEMINLNQMIFSDDYQDRKQRMFKSRIKEYHEAKRMIKRIEQLELDRSVTFQNLDDYIIPDFFHIIKQRHNDEYGEELDLSKGKNMQMIHKKYIDTHSICRPIILEALNSTKIKLNQYFKTRQKLALLNAFRMPVSSHPKHNRSYSQLQSEQTTPLHMNILFITKYSNGGKLSSHDWFLNGICEELKPEYSILMDVGLAPKSDAIPKMILHMEKHPKVGGVCGFMELKVEKVNEHENIDHNVIGSFTSFLMDIFNIQRAQQAEYHISHLIDKPFQSIFNFIHVLPGAFSGYRMKALKQDSSKNEEENKFQNSQIMVDYFKSINGEAFDEYQIKKTQLTPFQTFLKVIFPDILYTKIWPIYPHDDEKRLYDENVYLAEDRTLCLGIYLNGYDLHYLPDAEAQVDPIKSLHGLLGQRKRWINGSFFAFQKVKRDLASKGGSLCLTLQMLLLQLSNSLAFIGPAIFLYTIHLSVGLLFYSGSNISATALATCISLDNGKKQCEQILPNFAVTVGQVVDFICILTFLGIIFLSMFLTNRSERLQKLIYGASVLYGSFSVLVYIEIGIRIFGSTNFSESSFSDPFEMMKILITIFTIAILFLYLLALLFYLLLFRRISVLFQLICSLPSFIFHGSTYLNILNVYALCRIDDISWGTKGLDADASRKKTQNWKKIKILQVFKFLFWNSLVGFLLFVFDSSDKQSQSQSKIQVIQIMVIMALIFLILFIKAFCSLIYFIKYKLCYSVSMNAKENIKEDLIESLYRKVSTSLKSSIKSSILNQVKEMLEKDQFLSDRELLSKIQSPPSYHQRRYQQQRQIHQSRISHIRPLNPIKQQQESEDKMKMNETKEMLLPNNQKKKQKQQMIKKEELSRK